MMLAERLRCSRRQSVQPVAYRRKSPGHEFVVPFTAVVDGRDDAGLAEDPEVARDRRAADRMLGREIDHACGTLRETFDKRPTGRVGDRLECIHPLLVTHQLPIVGALRDWGVPAIARRRPCA